MEYFIILLVGLLAGTISGIVGFGSSIMLMPVLVIVFGPLQAVPIMAIAAVMANLSRVLVWWRALDWRAAGAYAVTAAPAAALGAGTLLVLPPHLIDGALGVFFILMVPVRRWMATHHQKLGYGQLSLLGVGIGYLTGIVVSTGPITAPLFLSLGLVKGAFLASEAASSLVVYLAKAIVFSRFGALPLDILLKGLITGASLMSGAYLAKSFVLSLAPERFRLLMDGLMLVSGATLLWTALFKH